MSEEKADPANPSVPVDTLARLFSLTAVRVQQLAKIGVVQKNERGRYDLWASIRGYIQYLQERSRGGGGTDATDSSMDEEKLKKLRAEREMSEMERDEMRGTLHRESAITKVYAGRVVAARAKMLSLPKKLAPQLVEMLDPVEIETIIKAEIYAALRELTPPAESNKDAERGNSSAEDAGGTDSARAVEGGGIVSGEGGSTMDATAGADGQRVGG